MPWALFRVSTSPAALTAVTRVDRTGLLEAAVATGSWAIPVKEPAPLAGTAEQAEPKSAPSAAEDAAIDGESLAIGEEAALVVPDPEAVEPLLEEHAARPPARASAASATGRRRAVNTDMGRISKFWAIVDARGDAALGGPLRIGPPAGVYGR